MRVVDSLVTFEFVVDARPRQAGVDPSNKLSDRTPEDIVTTVEAR